MGNYTVIGHMALAGMGALIASCAAPVSSDLTSEESAMPLGSPAEHQAAAPVSSPFKRDSISSHQLRGDRPPSALALQLAYPTPAPPQAPILPEARVETTVSAPEEVEQSEPLPWRERRKAKRMLPAQANAAAETKPPGETQRVRTTAYCRDEGDHFVFGSMSAIGKPLRLGAVRSAAADWSYYPAGTRFRIAGDDAIYEIDDYGSALVGSDTIDLYQPNEIAMEEWGVRHVDIEIIRWGSRSRSLDILRGRAGTPHIDTMISALERGGGTGGPVNGS